MYLNSNNNIAIKLFLTEAVVKIKQCRFDALICDTIIYNDYLLQNYAQLVIIKASENKQVHFKQFKLKIDHTIATILDNNIIFKHNLREFKY